LLLYEALAGRHPFWRASLAETAEAIALGAPPLHTERPDLPEPVLIAVDRALSVDASRRPTAAKLARMLRRARGHDLGRVRAAATYTEQRLLMPVLAAIYAAAAASVVPFYPGHAALVLAAVVGGTSFVAPRLGLAVALAVPVFPLGNIALALALLYGAVAIVWFALHVREPQRSMLPTLGPLLGVLALGLVPIAYLTTRSPSRRAIGAATALVLASAVAALRHGSTAPGIAGSRQPLPTAETLVAGAPRAFLYEVPAIALAAVVLPWAVSRARRLGRRASEARTYTG
jgi:hypothetical protein